MRKYLFPLVLVLAGCAGDGASLLGVQSSEDGVSTASNVPTIRTVTCEGPARKNCKFINSPVKLSKRTWRFADSPYPYYRTRDDLKFVDAAQDVWIAPASTWTDGASIPPIFVPFLGDPRSRQFMNASTVHDAYCAKRNEGGPYYHTATWQEVHRMFYDGLLASGTSPLKARIMYAAVYLGGPRWKGVRTPPRRQALRVKGVEVTPAGRVIEDTGLRRLQSNVPLTALVPKDMLVAAFKRAKAHIEANNPPVDELEVYLTRMEMDLTGAGRANTRRNNFRARPIPNKMSPQNLGGDDGGEGGEGGGEGDQ